MLKYVLIPHDIFLKLKPQLTQLNLKEIEKLQKSIGNIEFEKFVEKTSEDTLSKHDHTLRKNSSSIITTDIDDLLDL